MRSSHRSSSQSRMAEGSLLPLDLGRKYHSPGCEEKLDTARPAARFGSDQSSNTSRLSEAAASAHTRPLPKARRISETAITSRCGQVRRRKLRLPDRLSPPSALLLMILG